ncbi:hypothetical protein [Streptomyces sp. Je 1-369]|uniref:hypothetical protein n=1 Tax=Streptomyces sp. Je 1-369 TaxID=2966192 RepID=UPI0022866DBC|nr:hypothetical protein [Streptomyces sp. Je 1-369]WAL99218.1 hypothetical protein NOO62_34945 [Streptomyces sp. Je 1-369]
MIVASEDPGLWVLPVLFLLGAAIVAPLAGVVLAGRVVLRIARSAAAGDVWSALTPGTWLLAAGAGALGAGIRLSASQFDRPAPWVESVSLVCGSFALAAAAMAGLTAVLDRHLKTARDTPRPVSARGTRRP